MMDVDFPQLLISSEVWAHVEVTADRIFFPRRLVSGE